MFSILLYCVKISQYSISIDTEMMITDPESLLCSWYGIGRFGLCFIIRLLGLIPINIRLMNLLALIFLILSSIAWLCYINLCSNNKNNNIANLVFLMLFTSSPILAEQMGFTLQSFEIMLALFIEAIALILVYYWVTTNKTYFLISSIILLVFCFSCYQSFVILYIFGVVLSYVFKRYNIVDIDVKNSMVEIIKYIVILIFAMVIYMLINNCINLYYNIPQSSYLGSQVVWQNLSIIDSIIDISYTLIKEVAGRQTLYHPFAIIVFLYFVFIFCKNQQLKLENIIFVIIPSLALMLIPFSLTFLIGSNIASRSEFSFSILFASLVWFLLKEIKINKLFKVTIITSIVIQFGATFLLLLSAQNCYDLEVRMANEITEKIEETNTENTKLVFVGKYNPNDMLKGETLGKSFFEWDSWSEMGSNIRINTFFRTLNYNYDTPSLEDVTKAQKCEK